jgi:hypothetical protein
MLFAAVRSTVPYPASCLWDVVAKSAPDPNLARDGMLQDASALNLELARKAHGRWQSKRHIKSNCARIGDQS